MGVIRSGHLTQSFGLSHRMIAPEVGHGKLGDDGVRPGQAENMHNVPACAVSLALTFPVADSEVAMELLVHFFIVPLQSRSREFA
jgi:hypothetical protein